MDMLKPLQCQGSMTSSVPIWRSITSYASRPHSSDHNLFARESQLQAPQTALRYVARCHLVGLHSSKQVCMCCRHELHLVSFTARGPCRTHHLHVASNPASSNVVLRLRAAPPAQRRALAALRLLLSGVHLASLAALLSPVSAQAAHASIECMRTGGAAS